MVEARITKTSKEVPATQTKPTSRYVPGLENVDDSDIQMPRVKLNQSGSPLVKEDKAKEGDFSNSSSQDLYGKKVMFQPIMYSKSRIKFHEKGSKEIDCRSFDGKSGDVYGVCAKCKFSKWGEDRTPPPCNEVHNFLSIIREPKKYDGNPIVIAFVRTSLGEGRQLINKIQYSYAPSWNKLYALTSKKMSNAKYQWVVMAVDSGQPADKTQIVQAEGLYQNWRGKSLAVDMADESDEFGDNSDLSEADKTDADDSAYDL